MEYLATACAPLDVLLDGGLERDAITLVFGEGGSGKTNLALQCAREAARKGLRVAYVDTEGVSTVRLRQVFTPHRPTSLASPDVVADQGGWDSQVRRADGLALRQAPRDNSAAGRDVREVVEGRDIDVHETEAAPMQEPLGEPNPLEVEADATQLMDRVLFFTPFTIEEQERLVQNATRVPDLGLVVVDSINMHYRLHIDGGDESEKEAARSLYKQLHHLTGFARQNQVPVLVTGQVYGGEDTTQPFARRVMEHLVKALMRFEKRPDGTRRATVIKHRSIEEGRSARFRIGPDGLMPASNRVEPLAP